MRRWAAVGVLVVLATVTLGGWVWSALVSAAPPADASPTEVVQRYFRDLAQGRIADAHSLVAADVRDRNYGLTSDVAWPLDSLFGQHFTVNDQWDLAPADAEPGPGDGAAHFSGFSQCHVVWLTSDAVYSMDEGSDGGQHPVYGVILGRRGRTARWEIVNVSDDSP